MTRTVTIVAALAVVAACGTPAPKSADARKSEVVGRAEVLAAADNADGAVDRVVSKCAVCGLGMDGSPSHVSSHAGYEFHLCSAECKETFDRDPERVLARLARQSS